MMTSAQGVHAGSPSSLLLKPELRGGVGAYGTGYTSRGARWGDALAAVTAEGRTLVGSFATELSAFVVAPMTPRGASASVTFVPRVGWSWERFAVLAGPSVQVVPGAQPVLQVLPSLRTQAKLGTLGLSLGVFDDAGQVPAHLSVDFQNWSVGYVAPLGARACARVAFAPHLSVVASGFAYRLFNTDVAMLTLGVAWDVAR
jgi:hypothetical protein